MVVIGPTSYVNYHAYRMTYIITRPSRRRLGTSIFLPQLGMRQLSDVDTPIVYRRYRGTPYINTYPIKTLAVNRRIIRAGSTHYVNYRDYIDTYPFKVVAVRSLPKSAQRRVIGYSLYRRQRRKPTYIRSYPARTLRLLARERLEQIHRRHVITDNRGPL